MLSLNHAPKMGLNGWLTACMSAYFKSKTARCVLLEFDWNLCQ